MRTIKKLIQEKVQLQVYGSESVINTERGIRMCLDLTVELAGYFIIVEWIKKDHHLGMAVGSLKKM